MTKNSEKGLIIKVEKIKIDFYRIDDFSTFVMEQN
jgi:hypothetical protein